EREESADDAGSEAVQGAGAVAFEGEDVFGGPVDGFDPLADRREMRLVVVGGARVRGELGRGSQRGGAGRRVRGGGAAFLVGSSGADDRRVQRGTRRPAPPRCDPRPSSPRTRAPPTTTS